MYYKERPLYLLNSSCVVAYKEKKNVNFLKLKCRCTCVLTDLLLFKAFFSKWILKFCKYRDASSSSTKRCLNSRKLWSSTRSKGLWNGREINQKAFTTVMKIGGCISIPGSSLLSFYPSIHFSQLGNENYDRLRK